MKALTGMRWSLSIVIACANLIAQQPPQHSIVLKEGTIGAVKFEHTSHLEVAAKCIVCHHASKPLKPLRSSQEACTDCHTNPTTQPVTTGLRGAFHNAAATSGLCIDCHKEQNASGKAAPVKCADCHQRSSG